MKWLLLTFSLLTACDNFGDDRVAQLEREVGAMRAAQATAPPDIAGALSPLRQAIDMLVQRGDLERTRFVAVTQELAQLATLMQGFVDDSRRGEVEALRTRVLDLDRQIKEQSKAQGEERDLLLKALDLTATKLEAFLRQVSAQSVGTRSPGQAPGADQKVRKSWQDPAVVWPIGLGVLGLSAVFVLARRSRRAPYVTPLDLPIEESVVVDAPELTLDSVGAWAQHVPVSVRAEIGSSDVGQARERVAQWLAAEPRVLQAPAPEIEQRGPLLHVRFFVHDGMPAAERASLQADVQLRGQTESAAGRRSA